MKKFEKISLNQWNKDTNNISYENIKLPQRATFKSAGYDLYSPVNLTIMPNEQVLIPTGFKVNMDDDDVMLIIIRSSLGIKKGLSIANQVGVIDADYYNNKDNEGHCWIALRNNNNEQFNIKVGDRIAQAIFVKYGRTIDDEPIKHLRDGGIGSTSEK